MQLHVPLLRLTKLHAASCHAAKFQSARAAFTAAPERVRAQLCRGVSCASNKDTGAQQPSLLPLRPRDVGDTLDVDPFTPQFTGLPVVDASGYPVGVVSDKDVAAFLQAGSHTMDTPVSSVMSSPAITILDHSPLAYAAGKMLQFRIHRLVVVDGEGKATAMLTRSDVFQPLVPDVRKSDTTYVAKMEIMAAQAKATGTAASSRLLRTLEKVKDEAKAPRSPWG